MSKGLAKNVRFIIYLINKYKINSCYVARTVLGTRVKMVKKLNIAPPCGADSLGG